MIKHFEQHTPNSCWNKAADDEMVFVLLGHDRATAATIRFWVRERIRLGKNDEDDGQIREALACAEYIERHMGVHDARQLE